MNREKAIKEHEDVNREASGVEQKKTPQLEHPHAHSHEDVLGALGTGPEGLDAQLVAQRQEEHGPNKLPEPEQETAVQRLLRQFNDPMIYVLIAAAIVTAILGEWIDTGVIVAVVLINAVVGFVQEGKAADALAAIRTMLSPHTDVKREGRWTTIDAAELVPGDLVRLRSGDRVPADIRLAATSSLRIEESALTGESVPADKHTDAVEAEADLGDRSCMAYSGTIVAAGSGRGYVTGTGTKTEIGHITRMLHEVESVDTPLTRSMAKFSSIVAVVCVVLAVVMVIASIILYNFTFAELMMSAIGFAVAAIPEGLPAVMAITLALGVQRMAKRRAITRRMNSVETLGSVTTICTDKTGTLTRNEMTVREVVTLGGHYDVTGTGYAPEGEVLTGEGTVADLNSDPALLRLAVVADLVNDASLERNGDNWEMSGEPTDGGIKTFAMKSGVDSAAQGWRKQHLLPFDSEYKYMATLCEGNEGPVVLAKGAPDRLLARCTKQLAAHGEVEELDKDGWMSRIEQLGSQGMRVLAAMAKPAEGLNKVRREDVDAGEFTFLGLYGIIDPPRDEVIEAVKLVQGAGVRVRMITGDHVSTAAAIAREVGISGDSAMSGAEIEACSDEELRQRVAHTDVFARTSPEHKLRLVQALQANGEVVSMTGDGVNDAPSLKQADVGVAMGIKGTEATKEAADVVLADDNFATIAAAMHEGRTIYDNLRKAIVFMLPTNGAQGLVILIAMLAGMTLPITPLQVLWVNLITAVTLSLSLSFEPSEPGIMNRPPRDPKTPLLNSEAAIRIIYVSLLLGGTAIGAFLYERSQGVDLEAARTIAVNTLVVGQIFFLFASRFFRVSALRAALFTTNPISWLCVAIMLGLQLIFVYTPFMQAMFETTAVGLETWLVPLAVGVVIFAVVEIEKAVRRAVPHRE
ncbi:cation-transporting P-type ATPase [Corynebacterium urogenitale]